MHYGLRDPSGVGTESRSPGGTLRRDASGIGGAHGEPGLRIGPEGRVSRGAIHPDRGCEFHRGRWHGINDQCAVPPAAGPGRVSHGQRIADRRDDSRRSVGSVPGLPHGGRGGDDRCKIRHHPRGTGRVCGRVAPSSSGGHRKGLVPGGNRAGGNPGSEEGRGTARFRQG